METLVAFIVLLGILVFVHESGHFIVAKLCGVRVLKFSLGFGPPIGFGRFRLRWVRGHTEYVAAWIPLGGFVKMLGETPGEEDENLAAAHPDETLGAKPLWQKLAIVFAGPAMNLLLPVVIFFVTLFVGIERRDTVIGSVEAGSPAREAGLRAGDRISNVDGESVSWWGDVADVVAGKPGESVALVIERDGAELEIPLAVISRSALDEFGNARLFGWAGFSHERQRALIGITGADVPAATAGLRSGDLVIAVAGAPVEDWNTFRAAYLAATGFVELEIERSPHPGDDAEADAEATPVDSERLTRVVPVLPELADLGVIPASVLIRALTAGAPAERAGMQLGDLILAVDDEPVGSFASFAETVRTSGGRSLAITLARDGILSTVSVAPELVPVDIGLGIEEPRYLVGIQPEIPTLRGSTALDQQRNPLIAGPRAVKMTIDFTANFLRGLGKLLSGEVSRKQLAGPIGIAAIAGKAMERGWEAYSFVLILISINLGILNLLPIPILDGGQALLFLVEGVKRQPLSLRSREIYQQIGLTVLVMLMGLALWNDITRHWSKVVDWLRSGPGL